MTEFRSQFARYMEDMLELRIALGYSRNTYLPRLRRLDSFIAANFGECEFFSEDIVLGFIRSSARDGDPATGAKGRAGISRIFGEYLRSVGCDAYVLPKNFTVRKTKHEPYMMTDSELSAFFNEVDKISNSERDNMKRSTAAVMLRLIYTCGLRPGEGLRLKTKNVNIDTGEILVTETKLKKERIVVMHDDMKHLMRRYAMKVVLSGRDNTFFFPDQNGQSYMTTWLDNIVKTCFERSHSDIDRKLLPHVRTYDLRHRFASAALCRWLDEGRNLYNMLPYLRVYMGHKTLAQTAYYIHLLPENLLKSKGIEWDRLNDVIPEAEEEWED